MSNFLFSLIDYTRLYGSVVFFALISYLLYAEWNTTALVLGGLVAFYQVFLIVSSGYYRLDVLLTLLSWSLLLLILMLMKWNRVASILSFVLAIYTLVVTLAALYLGAPTYLLITVPLL